MSKKRCIDCEKYIDSYFMEDITNYATNKAKTKNKRWKINKGRVYICDTCNS